MPTQSANLNTDAAGVKTSQYYADRGDGTDNWHHVTRTFDGGDVTVGAKADAAVTSSASSGSVIALLKGLLSKLTAGAATILKLEDDAHTTADAGVMALAVRRDTAAVGSGTDGDYSTLNVDSAGRLRVRARTDEVDPSNLSTTALATSLVVKASAGKLLGFQGYTTTAGFVQVHNTTSLPADMAVPVEVIQVEANKSFSLSFGERGRACSTGITLVHSSTGPTKTISSAVMWVGAQFE